MFIDRVIVRVTAGSGGSGIASFRREKFAPLGGPDGGDGGKGGDVILRADSNLATLLDYSYRDQWEAERGMHGSGSNMTGHSGADITLPVPPGTVIRNHDTGEIIGEVLEDGDTFILAKGGRGGKGNSWFATSVHRSPREWQPGEEGQLFTIELELKLIADIEDQAAFDNGQMQQERTGEITRRKQVGGGQVAHGLFLICLLQWRKLPLLAFQHDLDQ